MQLYREEGRYLERTAPWIERVGLSYVKEKIVYNVEGRKALAARFHESQQHAQVDPWSLIANVQDLREFMPIKQISSDNARTVSKV